MCYIKEAMPKPAQVLVIGVDPAAQLDVVVSKAGEVVRHALPQGTPLDVWPLEPRDSLLSLVRNAGCRLFAKQPPRSFLSRLFRPQ